MFESFTEESRANTKHSVNVRFTMVISKRTPFTIDKIVEANESAVRILVVLSNTEGAKVTHFFRNEVTSIVSHKLRNKANIVNSSNEF